MYDELIRRESQLRATLYSIGDAVISTDCDGRITMMNPVAERLTGWSEAEALGRPLADVFRIVHEETRAEVENPVTRVLREGVVIGLANHSLLLARDGREYPIADAGAPIRNAAGEIVGVVLVFRDQTAERQAQRAVQHAREFAESIIATIREPLLVLDAELRIVKANRAFYRTFQVTPEETEGRFIYDLGNRQWDIPELRHLLEDILPQNTSFEDFEVEHDFERIGRRTMRLNARRLYAEKDKTSLILLAIEDVTEQKKAYDALRVSEERFRKISELISDYAYAFRVEPDLRLTGEWLTESFTRVFGYTREEIDARGGWQSVVFPEDLPRAQEHARKVASGTPDICEVRFVTRDGQVRWIRDYATPMWDERQGRVIRIYGAAQDITEQKQAERAIREREEWFRRLADTTATAIFIYQGEKLVYVNRASEELSGYSSQELLSLRFWDIVHPDDREMVRRRGLARQRGEKVPDRYEFRIVRKDGVQRWVDFTAGKIDWQGQPAALGTAFDITARKEAEIALHQSEQRYRSLFENVPEIVYSLSPDGCFTLLNPAFERITGWSVTDWLGKPFDALIHPDDRELARQQFARALRGETARFREMRILTKSGQTLVLEVLGVAHIQDGRTVGVTGFAHDVTERKQLERQLLQAQKMEGIGRLAGGIAHDFNNLLTVITGYSEMALLHLSETDPGQRFLAEIKKAACRATDLTRHLLAFSRQQPREPRPINLNDVITEMKQMLHRIIGEDIQMNIILQPDIGCVKADPLQMEQVILNLVVNARDAMPRGGTLTIQTATAVLEQEYEMISLGLTPGPYVTLTVADTGCGMDAETMSYIFEPFFTTKKEGTGLGLSTVYGIVKQSGGEITVTSEVGRGTTFTIYLPQIREPAADRSRADEAQTRSNLPLGWETILLVEDEPGVREVARTVLEACGYQVIVTETPSAALQVAEHRDQPLHLLLTDVVMPEMSGPELAERMVALRPEVKVLYMSGYVERANAQHILKLGVNFVLKPFTPWELASAVRRVLDRP